ncbi:hypothetical protein [Corynebacterium aquilae]|uniref:Uncharacterized protein n=1 Tax=Corynebacterium aquilae DSM 44791 TaxID=1431546 RepID=A0A1L7CIM3_9CORY|nr:hypothetical protein [Corynebacterium aquilae]APT85710.1 hypothetical protein CAQU_12455 [Corynebacterium aquilae DSM 44791]
MKPTTIQKITALTALTLLSAQLPRTITRPIVGLALHNNTTTILLKTTATLQRAMAATRWSTIRPPLHLLLTTATTRSSSAITTSLRAATRACRYAPLIATAPCLIGGAWAWKRSNAHGAVRITDAIVGCIA